MVLKGSVNFGPRGSTALGFGGHAHRAFPTVSVLENDFARSAAEVSDGLLSHSLETKPVKQPVEVQTKIVYRDSVIFKDVVVYETVEVEKELSGWQSFKMKMGGWFLGILIILIVFAILYIVKFLKP